MAEALVDDFATVLEAEAALGILRKEGIAGRVQARATGGIDQYLNAAGSWYELWVLEQDLERATPLIASFAAELERNADDNEKAAIAESGAPEEKPDEPERRRSLTTLAQFGGGLFQVHAVLSLGAGFIVSRPEGTRGVIRLVIPAVIDFALGRWIRAGGVNAARVGTVRLLLAAVLFGAGALFALPDRTALYSVAPVFALTASMMVLWWGKNRELGIVLFGVYAALVVASLRFVSLGP